MPKTIKLLLCFMLIAALLTACSGGKTAAYDISEYIAAFTAMDYAKMFSCSDPAVDIDQETFVAKYSAIFSGLGVTQVSVSDITGPDENGAFTFTAAYQTKDYGVFSNVFTLKTRIEEGKCLVLWDYSLIFPEMEEGCSVLVRTEEASRGEIFAADGSLLAENSYAQTVYMDVSKVQDIKAVSNLVCPLTGLEETDVVKKFNAAVKNGYTAVSLGAFPPGTLTDAQIAQIQAVPGLGVDDEMYTPLRKYPMGAAASHIVGYTKYVEEADLDEGYEASDRKGVEGLEAAYEDELRGRDGKIVYIENKWGDNIRTLWEEPKQEGQDLRTTIDPRLQQTAYDALCEYLSVAEGEKGVAIVLDGETGYVQAMASYPSYDDNIFNFPVSEEVWNALVSEEGGQPLFAYATQGRYPPGSVIKPFTAAAALEAGAITPDSVFTGTIIDNKWHPEGEGWTVTRVDDSGTPLKLYNALIKSDNIYFAWAALQMGEKSFLDYFTRIGFKEAVDFDLPVGQANLVGSVVDDKTLADLGYGQSELLVTPIQVAAMYTAFASGTGDMLRPILVEKICQTQGLDYVTLEQRGKTVWIEDAVPQSSLNILQPMLEAVITEGTGRSARIPGVTIAGKTGTAEIGNDKSREISWFAGYWVDGSYPRLVIVMVDVKANEGSVKFDIAKKLLMP